MKLHYWTLLDLLITGQNYIQALAEIYKVVELLELSAKVYKPWILLNGSHTSQILSALDECDALWSNSGLEEAVQSLSDNVDFGCSETAKALLAAIKNMREIDIFSMHERVFIQHKSICRLSLLPQEMLAGKEFSPLVFLLAKKTNDKGNLINRFNPNKAFK